MSMHIPDAQVMDDKLAAAVERALARMGLAAKPGTTQLRIQVAPHVMATLRARLQYEALGTTWRGIRIEPHPGPTDLSRKDDVKVIHTITRTETLA